MFYDSIPESGSERLAMMSYPALFGPHLIEAALMDGAHSTAVNNNADMCFPCLCQVHVSCVLQPYHYRQQSIAI